MIAPMRLVLFLLLCVVVSGLARAQTRVALVIGNGAYAQVRPLPNPPNDARAVADRLKGLGFAVTLLVDADKRAMDEAIRALGRRAPTADVAMLYYAGHGAQVDGRNYLIPVDAHLPQQTQDLHYEFVDVAQVMDQLSGARRLRVVVLDACRDNPIAVQLSRAVGRSLGGGRGLAAPPEMDNTLVAYATAADAVAADGDGAHSPFTQALLNHLADPNLDVRLMFGRVRDEVRRATNNQQSPFVYESLGGDSFAFNGGSAAPEPPAFKPPAPAPSLTVRPSPGPSRPALPPEPPPTPPPLTLSDLVAGRWRFSDGRGCGGGTFGTIKVVGDSLMFEWRLPGGGKNVAVEKIEAQQDNAVLTLVVMDVGTPRPEVGHRNRYLFEPGRWRSESLTTGERALHLPC